MRGGMVARQWRLLVMLRRGKWTRAQLADELGVCKRTVYRDLVALEAVPLPIIRLAHDKHRCARWTLEAMPEWPRNERTPVRELRAQP